MYTYIHIYTYPCLYMYTYIHTHTYIYMYLLLFVVRSATPPSPPHPPISPNGMRPSPIQLKLGVRVHPTVLPGEVGNQTPKLKVQSRSTKAGGTEPLGECLNHPTEAEGPRRSAEVVGPIGRKTMSVCMMLVVATVTTLIPCFFL